MLKTAEEIQGLAIHASDGPIGEMKEFYFDDGKWIIRYLIVNTGIWLPGKLVLISPTSLRGTDWEAKQLHVALTKVQIENSPDIDQHRPVSLQGEAEHMDYYEGPAYWRNACVGASGLYTDPRGASMTRVPPSDSHLRSSEEVKGYRIETADGDLGHVKDFIVDTESWSIRFLEIDTRDWLPGRHILISPGWIEKISWSESTVRVALPLETIRKAPEYLENQAMTPEYLDRLNEYYTCSLSGPWK